MDREVDQSGVIEVVTVKPWQSMVSFLLAWSEAANEPSAWSESPGSFLLQTQGPKEMLVAIADPDNGTRKNADTLMPGTRRCGPGF